ncbi:hypothetical protein ACFE04_021807 [Oxalis oulophora]
MKWRGGRWFSGQLSIKCRPTLNFTIFSTLALFNLLSSILASVLSFEIPINGVGVLKFRPRTIMKREDIRLPLPQKTLKSRSDDVVALMVVSHACNFSTPMIEADMLKGRRLMKSSDDIDCNLTTKIFKRQVHNNIEPEEQNWIPLPTNKASSLSVQISIQEPDQQGMWGSLDILTEIISQSKIDSPKKLALPNSSKGNGMNANENMVSINPLDPDMGNSRRMNELNINKAPSSCPIKNCSGKSCVSKSKKTVCGPPTYGPLANENCGVEPTTLVFGSSSVKGKQSAWKGRATTPTRLSVYSEAIEQHVWLKLEPAEKLIGEKPTNPKISIFSEVCPTLIVKIKGTTPMSAIQLYVAKKLGLPAGIEVEISCTQGFAMSPLVPLQTVADWWYTTDMVTQRPLPKVGDSTDERGIIDESHRLKRTRPKPLVDAATNKLNYVVQC